MAQNANRGRDDATLFGVRQASRTRANPQWRQLTGPAKRALWPAQNHFADALADAGFSDNRGAVERDIHATDLAASIGLREEKMVDPQLPFSSRLSVPRRRFLKGAAAAGILGAFPAIITMGEPLARRPARTTPATAANAALSRSF